jgi:hypothetical protein
MNSLYEVGGEIDKIIEEIISIGYRRIDGKIIERLKFLQEKAMEFNMARGAKDIENLIGAIKIHEKKESYNQLL